MSTTDDGRSSATREGALGRAGLWLARMSERWFPDALVFAFLGVVLVFAFGVALGERPAKLVMQGGAAFWTLGPFTLQMMMVIVGGYVVAASPPAHWPIGRLASIPKNGRTAVALIALFSMLTSLISGGSASSSAAYSSTNVNEMARLVGNLDYRAAGAAAYLGLGAIWALGLSSSAAMMMATRTAGVTPEDLLKISGVIPLTQTIFSWASLVAAAVIVTVSVSVAYWSAPSAAVARTAACIGLDGAPPRRDMEPRRTPGERLGYSPLLTVMID